jgi:4-amino-4-deoxychorismate lyase
MCQLFETIKINDGKPYNLKFHNLRFNTTRKDYFGINTPIDLSQKLTIPINKQNGLYRCKITYSQTLETIEFIPHKFRQVTSLKLIFDNTIDYNYKNTNRELLQKLYEQRNECDDILIIKNGCITDSYTANPIFFDGKKWWSPNTFLLPGTQRARYIEEGKIHKTKITVNDLSKYKKVGLINAMWDFKEMPVINIANIF